MFDSTTDPCNPRLQLLNKQRAANSPNKSQSEDHKATSSCSLTNARRLQCIIYLYTPRVAFAAVTRRKKSLSLSLSLDNGRTLSAHYTHPEGRAHNKTAPRACESAALRLLRSQSKARFCARRVRVCAVIFRVIQRLAR